MKSILSAVLLAPLLGVTAWAQCPLAQNITPQPVSVPLELLQSETAGRYASFAGEVNSLVIRQQTTVAGTGERLDETLWVRGNRYRLERTDAAGRTLTYLYDGEVRWIITPGGQRAKTSGLETPQPYLDWSRWIAPSFEVMGLGEYRGRSAFMLKNPQVGADQFTEVWVDAERLIPLVVRQDTALDRVVTVFADHRLLEGTRFGYIPWMRELYTNGELLETTVVQDIQFNVPLEPALFEVEP